MNKNIIDSFYFLVKDRIEEELNLLEDKEKQPLINKLIVGIEQSIHRFKLEKSVIKSIEINKFAQKDYENKN